MEKIQSKYNLLGIIQDPTLRNEFYEINYQRTPFVSYLFLFLLFSLIYFPINIANIIAAAHKDASDSLDIILFAISLGSLIGVTTSLFIIMYSKSYFPMVFTSFLSSTNKALIYCLCLYQLSRYFQITLSDNCETQQDHLSLQTMCSSYDRTNSSLLMIAGPIILITILRNYHLRMNCCYLLATCSALLFDAFRRQSYSGVGTYFLFLFSGIMMLYDQQIQNVTMFLLNHKLQDTLDENERHADEIHADEMRHMIANVAHDLKTPLTSFMTGMELIKHIVLDCQSKLYSKQLTVTIIQESIGSTLQCVENIRDTNSFMLMTINRCIDYTKASKGMKLIPRYETIHLQDTLLLPFSCMKNIQNRIEIILNPLPPNICSHIITDLQWLQENILCLLSNAVKYSTEGTVTIKVSLIQMVEQNERVTVRQANSKRVVPFDDHSSKHFSINLFTSFYNKNSDDKIISSTKESPIGPKGSISPISPVSPTDSPAGKRKSAFNQTKHLRFEIEDTGIGMTDEAMQTLFNPFKQTQRLAGGTGLGLYSLAKRVEALNGKYGVRKRRDGKQGSLFWFAIPYRPDEVTAQMTSELQKDKEKFKEKERKEPEKIVVVDLQEQPQPEDIIDFNSDKIFDDSRKKLDIQAVYGSSIKTKILKPPDEKKSMSLNSTSSSNSFHFYSKSWTILLVDDSPSIIKMTTMMLSKQGHTIHTAENGEEAVKKIQKRWEESSNVYDLVLMDLQMPVMDGLEATRRIRAFEKPPLDILDAKIGYVQQFTKPYQLIIGLSANSDHETMEAAMSAGADSFLAKPFQIEKFYNVANLLMKEKK